MPDEKTSQTDRIQAVAGLLAAGLLRLKSRDFFSDTGKNVHSASHAQQHKTHKSLENSLDSVEKSSLHGHVVNANSAQPDQRKGGRA